MKLKFPRQNREFEFTEEMTKGFPDGLQDIIWSDYLSRERRGLLWQEGEIETC